VRKRVEGTLDVGVHHVLEDLALRILDQVRRVLLDDPFVRLFNLGEVDLVRRELLLPVVVDERVLHDLEEPRLEVRAFLELVVVLVGLEVGLLHEILGVFRVPRHAVGSVVEGVDVGHRCLFEVPSLLVISCYSRLHRVSRTSTSQKMRSSRAVIGIRCGDK